MKRNFWSLLLAISLLVSLLTFGTLAAEPVEPADTITVTFTMFGDFPHGDPNRGGTAHEGGRITWIPRTVYTGLPADSTVCDVFLKAVEENGMAQKGAEQGYVEKIKAPDAMGGDWLGAMENGPWSGWMYTINGVFASQGLKDQEVRDGDQIVWLYVDDYTVESDDMEHPEKLPDATVELDPAAFEADSYGGTTLTTTLHHTGRSVSSVLCSAAYDEDGRMLTMECETLYVESNRAEMPVTVYLDCAASEVAHVQIMVLDYRSAALCRSARDERP